MSPPLSTRARLMPASPIRKLMPLADDAKRRGVHIYHLNIGQPDIETPAVMRERLGQIHDRVLAYTPSAGTPEYLHSLQTYYRGVGIELGLDELMATTGGSEAILFALLACANEGDDVLVVEPFYTNYSAFATMAGVHLVPLTARAEDGFHLPERAAWERARTPRTRAVILCNPNNPTGASVPATAVASFVAMVKAAAPDAKILVDEAYFEYVDDPAYTSAVPLIATDKRVLVTRTFSKIFGMAGLRVGYVIAHPDTIADLRKQGSSGTLTGASLAAAAAALSDPSHLAPERARNTAARGFTREKFESAGFRVLPSSANFVMIDIKRDAGAFQALCRQQQIQIARPFPPLTTCVRVSIGTMAEMQEAVPAMLSLLAAPPPMSARADVAPGFDDLHLAGGAC